MVDEDYLKEVLSNIHPPKEGDFYTDGDHVRAFFNGEWKTLDSEPFEKESCNHEYKLYTGLTEQFEYCVKCDQKKESGNV